MKKKFCIAILILLIISFFVYVFFAGNKTKDENFNKENYSQIYFYDLGNSTIEIIKKNNYIILINTGYLKDRDNLLDCLDQFGIEKIDYLILTNKNDKYIENASYILEHFMVDYVYLNDYDYESDSVNKLSEVLLDNYAEDIVLSSNENIFLDDLKINIYPYNETEYEMNDKSFIINLLEGDNSIYLTYDNTKRLKDVDRSTLVVSENKVSFDVDSKYYLYDGKDKVMKNDNVLKRNLLIYMSEKEFIIK